MQKNDILSLCGKESPPLREGSLARQFFEMTTDCLPRISYVCMKKS